MSRTITCPLAAIDGHEMAPNQGDPYAALAIRVRADRTRERCPRSAPWLSFVIVARFSLRRRSSLYSRVGLHLAAEFSSDPTGAFDFICTRMNLHSCAR